MCALLSAGAFLPVLGVQASHFRHPVYDEQSLLYTPDVVHGGTDWAVFLLWWPNVIRLPTQMQRLNEQYCGSTVDRWMVGDCVPTGICYRVFEAAVGGYPRQGGR